MENDLVIVCYDTAKMTLYNMWSIMDMEQKANPWWNMKKKWILKGGKAVLLLIIENLNKMEAEYKIKKLKENKDVY